MSNTTPAVAFPRLPEEPAADYAALLQHRDLGAGRSLSHAVQITGLSESTLRRLAKRWDWSARLAVYDEQFLERVAAIGGLMAEDRHRGQLIEFRDAQNRRAEQLGSTAERLLQLVTESIQAHLSGGTLLQPVQLGAALTAAARAMEASGSTAAMALGVDELLDRLAAEVVDSSPGIR